MKVLHLAAGNLFGGVETYLITLARLRYLCPELEPAFGLCFPGRLRDELLATGVPVHDLGVVRVSRPWTILRARSRLKLLLREYKYDAVVAHSSWPHMVFAPVVRRLGTGLLHAIHSEVNPNHWLNRWAARTPPDVVIANSRFIANCASVLFPRCPSVVIHPPIVECKSNNRATVRERIRGEFGTHPEAVVVLIVSRIEELKGHRMLFAALERIQKIAGWVCWVVGGAQRPSEEALLADLKASVNLTEICDRVRFVGARSDVSGIMTAADIYCQPNTRPEGFGLTLIEAMQAGLPVVTSGFGGALDIVTNASGVLCQPKDVTAISEALQSLIADPNRRQELGIAGAARAAELCDPERQMEAWATAMGLKAHRGSAALGKS